ncbi:prolow-density lipoprotein receptor-related protein 1-like [Trichogramma pretiosum]|uniref:prolow-density lipoprotein receptor-related protein 1-like n=1 Tax=Trichogramma pretiosum TaxID=7493 RepID=UPI000C71A39A|nr:prolow-density lipoprotein receptor-related protein 1-like [Trichogramma pretiosum]
MCKPERNCYYVSAGAIVTLVMIIVGAGFSLIHKRANVTDISLKFSNGLVIQLNNSSLLALDVATGNYSYVFETDDMIDFDFYSGHRLFINTNKSIQTCSETCKGINEKYHFNWNADAIVADKSSRKLYITDRSGENLYIVDIGNKYYNVVHLGISDLQKIVLDSLQGLVFISTPQTIIKGNMDGSWFSDIVQNCSVSAFALNRKEKSLYFADRLFIWSVDYSGKNKRLVATTRNHVTNLVFSAGKLFFTTDGGASTAMSSCSVSNGVCSDITDTHLPGHIVQMKAYNFADWLVDNPCHYGSCEQMCLLNANQNYTCACKLGWRLASDEISCEKIHEYLIYRQDNYFRGIILNSTMNQFKKAFEPIKLNSIADGALTTFDYDARKNVVVFADSLTLRKLDLTSGSEKFFLENLSSDGVLALDWLSGKIIYVRDDVFGGCQRIVSRGIDDFSETDSSVVLYKDFDPFERVRSLTVHPVRGLIFFTIFEITSRQSRISQMRVDGTEARSFFVDNFSDNINENLLAIDYREDRLYWFSADNTTLHHTNLDGTDLISSNVQFLNNPTSVNVYENWVYVTDSIGIWRVNKNESDKHVQLINDVGIHSAKIFSKKQQILENVTNK